MLVYLIQFAAIIVCFVFIYFNHTRISKAQLDNDRLMMETKKKINALNTILLQKYDQKQNIDSKIMSMLIRKVNIISDSMDSKDNALQIEIDNLKSTLNYLQDQNTIFNNFEEEAI